MAIRIISNERGQAALADSLFFLLIVSGLATLLFLFSNSYGQNVVNTAQSEYYTTFATSALKAILYSSTPRDPTISLDQSTEIDYLLAAVKEDYADDKVIDESRSVVRDNIVAIMEPLSDSFDYMFYIYSETGQNFPLLMIYHNEINVAPSERDRRRVTIGEGVDKIYFCSPRSQNDVDYLLSNVGKVYQSNSRMQLVESTQSGAKYSVAIVHLSMWLATNMPESILGAADPSIGSHSLNCMVCDVKRTQQGGAIKWIKC